MNWKQTLFKFTLFGIVAAVLPILAGAVFFPAGPLAIPEETPDFFAFPVRGGAELNLAIPSPLRRKVLRAGPVGAEDGALWWPASSRRSCSSSNCSKVFWPPGEMVNTLRPRQDGRHFPDDIFKSIF